MQRGDLPQGANPTVLYLLQPVGVSEHEYPCTQGLRTHGGETERLVGTDNDKEGLHGRVTTVPLPGSGTTALRRIRHRISLM